MTIAVQSLLETFDQLSDADRQEAIVEILRRVAPSEGELPEEALLEAADALFCALDTEEATNAGP
jgi:NADH:ubiquinone oxidoreductase subunit E